VHHMNIAQNHFDSTHGLINARIWYLCGILKVHNSVIKPYKDLPEKNLYDLTICYELMLRKKPNLVDDRKKSLN